MQEIADGFGAVVDGGAADFGEVEAGVEGVGNGIGRVEIDFADDVRVAGGFGALCDLDGKATMPGSSNMGTTPVEIFEPLSGLVVERKALRPDSGGAGEFRGGVGQTVVLRNEDYEHQFGLSARPPASLGSALEVRAELAGASVRQIQSWSGRVFAEFGATDASATSRRKKQPIAQQ